MAVKVSVTLDDEILAEARGLAPDGNLSALENHAWSRSACGVSGYATCSPRTLRPRARLHPPAPIT